METKLISVYVITSFNFCLSSIHRAFLFIYLYLIEETLSQKMINRKRSDRVVNWETKKLLYLLPKLDENHIIITIMELSKTFPKSVLRRKKSFLL